MNNYGNKFGYHSPEQAEKFAALLNEAGIPFEDASWHNDELDRFSIPFTERVELHVWIGNPKHEDKGYHTNSLFRYDKVNEDRIDYNEDLAVGTLLDIVAKIKSMQADLLTTTGQKLDACAAQLFGDGTTYEELSEYDRDLAFGLYLGRHAIKGSVGRKAN
jgi:hypothetical protein